MGKKRVCLGKIGTPHGIKGLVKLIPFGDDSSLIQTLGPAYTDPQSANALSVTIKSSAGKYLIAEVEGVNSRNDAEDIRNTELYFDRDLLPKTKDDEFYYEDLAGLTVIENDEDIGKVKAVHNFGAGDLLEIKLKSSPPFYLPFSDDHICDINIEQGIITIKDSQEFQEE